MPMRSPPQIRAFGMAIANNTNCRNDPNRSRFNGFRAVNLHPLIQQRLANTSPRYFASNLHGLISEALTARGWAWKFA
jgi:hypothetical protein